MPERKTIPIIVTSVAVVALVAFGVFAVTQKKDTVPETQPATVTSIPQKTDYGANVPTDFPTDIPVEKGVKFEQSYGLSYVGQKQLTIVFLSTKTVKENYSLYADFVKKQGWVIFNKYENEKLSSLYGTKGDNDINVTISENTAAPVRSQVSISVLKK